MPDRYTKLKEKARRFIPSLSGSTYENTRSLRNFLKKLIRRYRDEVVTPARISEIITERTSFIRSHTLRKILEGKDLDPFSCPFPIYNELIKMEIEKDFERAVGALRSMKASERLRLFLSTFTAMIGRNEFYLSRKDKFLEAFSLLRRKKDIASFKDFMSNRYETMLFVIDMIDPHPYVKGRREAAMRFFGRLSSRKLEAFARVYANLQDDDRQTLDRFLRNYGRYEVMRLRTRLKGPQTVRNFAKRFGVRVQPIFAAYWAEEDGRTRRKIERILRMFLTGS